MGFEIPKMNKQEKDELIETVVRLLTPMIENITNATREGSGPWLLTIKQAAELFNVTNATIHNWRNEGKIRSIRKGGRVYFNREELIKSMNSNSK